MTACSAQSGRKFLGTSTSPTLREWRAGITEAPALVLRPRPFSQHHLSRVRRALLKALSPPSIDSSRVRQLAYYPASKWQSEVQVQVCLIPKPMFFLGNDV